MEKNKIIFIFFLFVFSAVFVIGISEKEREESVASGNLSKYVMDKASACHKTQSRTSCLKSAAEDIFRNTSTEKFLSIVKENEKNPAIFNTCHDLSHYIGRLEYQKEKNLPKVFSQCQHVCLDGCYHGAVEGYFISKDIVLSEDNMSLVGSELAKLCGKAEDYNVVEVYITCLHGLGHAAMFAADYDLLKALNLCDALATIDQEELCYTGAFMANSAGTKNSDHPSKYLREEDPMYPCTILAKKHQKTCYEYNTLSFYNFTNYDWKKTIELCGQVPKDYRRGCYQTMGADQVGMTDNINDIKNACNEIKEPEFNAACIVGAESNLVMRYSQDFRIPIKYCEIMRDDQKKPCYYTFISHLNKWSRIFNEKKPICQRIIEEKYMKECLNLIK